MQIAHRCRAARGKVLRTPLRATVLRNMRMYIKHQQTSKQSQQSKQPSQAKKAKQAAKQSQVKPSNRDLQSTLDSPNTHRKERP